MYTPSFFFHIKVDLTEPAPHFAELANTNGGLVTCSNLPLQGASTSQHAGIVSAGESEAVIQSRQLFPAKGVDSRRIEHQSESEDAVDDERLAQKGDWRWGKILLRNIDMSNEERPPKRVTFSKEGHRAISANSGSLATKGKFEPLDSGEDELGWGVVRLYRDADETAGLYDDVASIKSSKHTRAGHGGSSSQSEERSTFRDDDCTMLCILAVPSYLTPSDFLGFVGERTREDVSHFRMIRTERSNRYMVLMKFHSGKRAREWHTEWNGKVFNDMEVRYSRGPNECT